MNSYYAVKHGRNPGIYSTWEECKTQINGFPKAIYKKFHNEQDALNFLIPDEIVGDNLSTLPREAQSKPANMIKLDGLTTLNSKVSLSTIKLKDDPSFKRKKLDNYVSLPTVEKQPVNLNNNLKQTDTNITNETCKCQCSNEIKRLQNQVNYLNEKVEKLEKKLVFCDGTDQYNKTCSDSDLSATKKFKTNTGDGLDVIYVYTDGACENNGKKGAKAGLGVYFGDGHELNISEKLEGRPTNNRAEIHAAVRALEQIRKLPKTPQKIVLFTDSQFLINSITKWIKGWKKNGWKLKTGGPVVNREDFEKLDRVRDGLNVEWTYVKGHNGVKGNEEADRLAVAALRD